MKTTLGEIEQHLQAFFSALHDTMDGGTLTFVSDLRGVPRPNKETRVRFLLWEIARPAVTYPPSFFPVLPYVSRVGDGGVCRRRCVGDAPVADINFGAREMRRIIYT